MVLSPVATMLLSTRRPFKAKTPSKRLTRQGSPACRCHCTIGGMTKELWQDPFQLMVPLALLIGTLLAGLIVRRVLFGVLRRWAAHSRSQLDVLITESLKGPIVLWALILGVHL